MNLFHCCNNGGVIVTVFNATFGLTATLMTTMTSFSLIIKQQY
jgi:hypothetical protein